NSDGFNFDTQIIIQLHHAQKSIVEIPIPTYYGEEISYVNGLKYAKDICSDVLRYRIQRRGFASGNLARIDPEQNRKSAPTSSHGRIAALLAQRPPGKVLDLGCADGWIASQARRHGHKVTGVDVAQSPGVESRVDTFIQADLDAGLPTKLHGKFD